MRSLRNGIIIIIINLPEFFPEFCPNSFIGKITFFLGGGGGETVPPPLPSPTPMGTPHSYK